MNKRQEIKLSHGKTAIVDDNDFESLSKYKWHADKNISGNWYAIRRVCVDKKQKNIRMHRKIMNAPQCMQIDHINGNGLDNRKKNLRLCTHQQNQFNQKYAHKDNKLGIKGVYWREDLKKFQTQIRINSKLIYLGLFNVLGDADSAYRKAEIKYFKDFARKNSE